MISKYSHKELTWIDLESPNNEEISHIIELLSVPVYIAEKINNNTKEDILDIDERFIFTSMKGELIFVVNDDYILTIHSKSISAFRKFGKEMELDIIVEEKSKIKNNKLLFAYLIKNLHLSSQDELFLNNIQIKKLKKELMVKNKKLKLFIILSIILLVTIIISLCL